MSAIESIYAEYVIDTKKAINQINDLLRNTLGANEKISSSSEKAEKKIEEIGDAFLEASKDSKKFSTQVEESFNKIDSKANTLIKTISGITATLGAVAIFKDIEQVGMSFTTQISRLGAATNATKEELNTLRVEAERLGSTTQFSASEAASAMVELGKAGLNTSQIMSATNEVLNLASAGELSLAQAASIAADTMSQFNLKAEQMGMIADVISATANSSTISVHEVAESLKYAGSIANAVGVPIQQVGAMISIMGSAGIKASMAGTALRSMFLRLSDPPKEAADSLKQLGIQIIDSNGKMRTLGEIFNDFKNKFKDLSETKQIELLSKIFGAEAASGVLALIKAGGDRINELSESLLQQGKAAEVASKNNDNLEGDYKALSSAIEGVKISIFNSLEPALRSIIQIFGGAFQSINSFIQAFPNLSRVIVIVTSSLIAFATAIVGVNGVVTAFKSLELGLALSQAKLILFGNTLSAQAQAARAKWLSILGPFGLALGASVLTYTIVLDVIERKRKEETKQQQGFLESDKNLFTLDLMYNKTSKLNENLSKLNSQELSGLKSQLESIKKEIESIDVKKLTDKFDKEVPAKLSLGFEKVLSIYQRLDQESSRRIAEQYAKLRTKDALPRDFASLLLAAIQNIDSRLKDTNPTLNEASSLLGKVGNAFSSLVSSGTKVVDIFNQVDEAIKNNSFKNLDLSLNVKNTPKAIEEIKSLQEHLRFLGATVDANIKNKDIDIKIKVPESEITKARMDEIRDRILRISEVAKTYHVKVEAKQEGDFWAKWEKATGSLNDFESQIKSIESQFTTLNATMSSGNGFEIVGASAKTLAMLLDKLGQSYLNLLRAQNQLDMTKLRNQFNQLNAIIEYSLAFLDKELDEFNKAQQEKIKAVDDRIKEIERLEREHLDNLRKMKEQFDAEEKARIDALFQQEAEMLRIKYEQKVLQLQQEVTDQDQFNTLQAIAYEDFQNELQRKREEYDELYRQNVEAKAQEFKQKEDEIRDNAIASKEEEEKQKQKIEEEGLKKKQDIENQKAQLRTRQAQIQYIFDLAQFQADKHMKIQQAKLSFATTMVNAVAGLAASFANGGPIGFAIGIALMPIITGLALAALSTTLAAINATQPPLPPPAVFGLNKGGLVEGYGNSDTVPAMLTPGELVVPKENFQDVVNRYATVENNNNARNVNVNLTFNNTFNKDINEESIINKISEQVVKSIRFGVQEYSY